MKKILLKKYQKGARLIPKFQHPFSMGNYVSDEAVRKASQDMSKKIMHKAYRVFTGGEPSSDNILQDSFINPNFEREILDSGKYIKGDDSDRNWAEYAFTPSELKKASGRIYRRSDKIENIDESKLKFIGKGDGGDPYAEGYIPEIDMNNALIDPGNYPSLWFVDDEGYLYRRSYDLQDYGGNGGGTTTGFWGDLADFIGYPSIQTTGLVKQIENGKHINVNDKSFKNTDAYISISNMLKKKGIHMEKINGKMEFNVLPDIIETGKKRKHYNGGLIKRNRLILKNN